MFAFEGSHNEISEDERGPETQNKPSKEVSSMNGTELDLPRESEDEGEDAGKTEDLKTTRPESEETPETKDPNSTELVAPEEETDAAETPEVFDGIGNTEKGVDETDGIEHDNDPELPLSPENEAEGESPDGTDWERTSLTPEQEQKLREMEEKGKIDIPEIDPDWEEPDEGKKHLPTEKTGRVEGERGDSAFYPNDEDALEKMKEYGQDHVDYRNGDPDFSPFTKHDTPFGEMDGQVEIAHMTDNRENPSWEFGRRPDGTKHDPNYDLGNFTQADLELSRKMNGKMSPEEIEKFRKDNNLTWHECPDGKTMQLVPAEIHDACRHSGGVSEQKYRQAWGDITAPY